MFASCPLPKQMGTCFLCSYFPCLAVQKSPSLLWTLGQRVRISEQSKNFQSGPQPCASTHSKRAGSMTNIIGQLNMGPIVDSNSHPVMYWFKPRTRLLCKCPTLCCNPASHAEGLCSFKPAQGGECQQVSKRSDNSTWRVPASSLRMLGRSLDTIFAPK